MPTYKQLQTKHPEYDAKYWRRLRGLYAGGKKLLGDKALMREVFPPHLKEAPHVYDERLARAYYIPYAGEIIDSILAGLFADKVTITSEPQADPYYQGFYEDVSPPGGKKMTLAELLKNQVLTALLCKRSWTLVDLPVLDPQAYSNLAEQEQAGGLSVYACPIDPECVVDWEVTDDGELLWANVHYSQSKRMGLESTRDVITEEWMHYTPTNWEKYSITYNVTAPPTDETDVPLVAEGRYSFNKVPLLRFEVNDGMWAMGKIEPIAVAHLNKRNALTWAEYKSLFPVLTHFAGPLDPMNPATDDPNRMLNQTVGQGYVAQLGDKDRLEFVGPDTTAYTTAMKDLDNLRDEMHRVLHSMAMSVDNSGAALQRSAESKQVDQSSTAIVLKSLGQDVREYVVELYKTVQAGRGETAEIDWQVQGLEKYDEMGIDALVTQAQTLETVSIPSATFQRALKFGLAKRLLGDAATEDQLKAIETELAGSITQESFDVANTLEAAEQVPPARARDTDDEDDYEDDE